MESKALEGKYSYTNLYNQAVDYAKTCNMEDVFVITNKGLYLSFGIYIQDFHSKNGFHNKGPIFDGYIGLECTSNLNVKTLAQLDVFSPQHRLYKLNHDYENSYCIMIILDYLKSHIIEHNGIERTKFSFGRRIAISYEGFLIDKERVISTDERGDDYRKKILSFDNLENVPTDSISEEITLL